MKDAVQQAANRGHDRVVGQYEKYRVRADQTSRGTQAGLAEQVSTRQVWTEIASTS